VNILHKKTALLDAYNILTGKAQGKKLRRPGHRSDKNEMGNRFPISGCKLNSTSA
jgi:hypothetical protein